MRAAFPLQVEIQKPKLVTRASLPWLTATMAAVAIGERVLPGAQSIFLYDRTLILEGQGWRLWSGHLAHYSFSHLFWNLVVFVPAGVWLERTYPRWTRLFLIITPVIISGALLYFEPQLQIYAGISGVAVGTLAMLALYELRQQPPGQKWVWGVLLTLIVVKMAAEYGLRGTAFFVSFPTDFHNVPLSHLMGAICAVGIFAFSALREHFVESRKRCLQE
jgi:rhomboid family GlyGly-CTERM serine protease